MASSDFEFFALALNRVETLHTAFCRIKNQYGQVFPQLGLVRSM